MTMFEPPEEISFEMAQAQYDEAVVVAIEGPSRFPGMTFEDGVAAALGWLLQEREEPPLEIVPDDSTDLLLALQESVKQAKAARRAKADPAPGTQKGMLA